MTDVVALPSPGNPDEISESDLIRKLKKFLKWLPFGVGTQLVALYLAMQDPLTPWALKVIIAGALAYFILPFDIIPDWLGPLGMSDDAAAIYAAYKACGDAIKDEHKLKAGQWLGLNVLPGASS
ncbi:MAG: DUF1232 domain-containing protein [Planctomycetes bacterium]|nr:DUF1232 domain-containing protein [Planctomycetota bacterium]